MGEVRRMLDRYAETADGLASIRIQRKAICGTPAHSPQDGAGETRDMPDVKICRDCMDALLDDLEAKEKEALEARRRIAADIERLFPDGRDRAIVEMRWLAHMDWEAIADVLGYSDGRSVRRRAAVAIARAERRDGDAGD